MPTQRPDFVVRLCSGRVGTQCKLGRRKYFPMVYGAVGELDDLASFGAGVTRFYFEDTGVFKAFSQAPGY